MIEPRSHITRLRPARPVFTGLDRKLRNETETDPPLKASLRTARPNQKPPLTLPWLLSFATAHHVAEPSHRDTGTGGTSETKSPASQAQWAFGRGSNGGGIAAGSQAQVLDCTVSSPPPKSRLKSCLLSHAYAWYVAIRVSLPDPTFEDAAVGEESPLGSRGLTSDF